MPAQLVSQPGGVKAMFQASLPRLSPGLAWLGQSGFALRYASQRLLIDPYLSDYLALKHTGSDFSHVRLMPSPMPAEKFRGLGFVLCSHRHGDHMDPGSLPILARNNPDCRFVVPRAEMEVAMGLGLTHSQLLPIDDGETIQLAAELEVRAVASAHESLETDSKGHHRFLGFILRFGVPALSLYHSGDCVVYDGLGKRLRDWPIDIALLPVNGRSPRLAARGIAGNMDFEEARSLCLAAGIRLMVPHHFGMFAFNSVELPVLERQVAQLDRRTLGCVIPTTDCHYLLAK